MIAAAIVSRSWGNALARIADIDDFRQQAWVEYLDKVESEPSPLGVRRDVWEIGVTVRRLWEWCRKWDRKLKHEPVTSSFREEGDGDDSHDTADERVEGGFRWVDAVDVAQEILEPREASLVYMRAAGMTFPEIASVMKVSVSSVWQWAAQIRAKVKESK